MNRVVLTGATGFVGRHTLSALLRAGYEVHAITRHPTRACARGVTWHQADLLHEPKTVADLRADILIHLAWYTERGRFWCAPQNVTWRDASLAMLRAFTVAGGRRAVIAGTCAEYAWTRAVYHEESACRPATAYGTMKHDLLKAASELAEETALSLAWARLFFPYGPNEDPRRFVPTVSRALLAGELAPMTSGTQVRDLMHVYDVAAALVALAASSVTGAVNVASGEGVTLRAVAEEIAAQTGPCARLGLAMLADRDGEPASLVADVRRLREHVGFRTSITLGEGIELTVDWWRRQRDASASRP